MREVTGLMLGHGGGGGRSNYRRIDAEDSGLRKTGRSSDHTPNAESAQGRSAE